MDGGSPADLGARSVPKGHLVADASTSYAQVGPGRGAAYGVQLTRPARHLEVRTEYTRGAS